MNLTKFKKTFFWYNTMSIILFWVWSLSKLFFITRDGWKRQISTEELAFDVLTNLVLFVSLLLFFNLSYNVFKLFASAQDVTLIEKAKDDV